MERKSDPDGPLTRCGLNIYAWAQLGCLMVGCEEV